MVTLLNRIMIRILLTTFNKDQSAKHANNAKKTLLFFYIVEARINDSVTRRFVIVTRPLLDAI